MRKATKPKKSASIRRARSRSRQLAILGSRVQEARNALGWTQQELADAVGVHRVEISNIENGGRESGVLRIVRLAHVLGVSPDWLLYSIHSRPADGRRTLRCGYCS